MRNITNLILLIYSVSLFGQLPTQADDPQSRLEFEVLRTKDPKTNKIPKNIFFLERKLMEERQSLLTRGRALAKVETEWTNRGPYNVGGRTRALAIDITDTTENTILAGGVSGGLWRTEDGGQTWTKRTALTDLQSITCLAQDPRAGSENIWYYGTGEIRGNSASSAGGGGFYRGDGIFKSTDGGLTWSVLPATSTNIPQAFDNIFDYSHELVVNPANGDVFVATQLGIYRSENGGTSFDNSLQGSGWSDIAVTTTGILYAAVEENGIFQSIDNGETWSNISDAGIAFGAGDRFEIAIAPSDEDIVYTIGEQTAASDYVLWRYNDELGVWADLSGNIPRLGGSTGDFNSQGGYNLLIKVKKDDPDFLVIGGTNLFTSSDGFATQENTTWVGGYTSSNESFALYPNHHPDQHAFIFLSGNRAYSGNDGGVQLTNDITSSNVEWDPLNNGYQTSQIYAVSAGPEDQLLIGLQDNGTWFADNSTSTVDAWADAWGADGAYSAINSDGSIRFLSSQNGNVTIWNYADANDPAATSAFYFKPPEPESLEDPDTPELFRSSLFIAPFYLDREDNNLFYLGGDDELWVNTQATSVENQDGASTGWKPIGFPAGVSGVVSEIGIGKETVVYLGTSSGNVIRISNAADESPIVENVTGTNLPGGYISGVSVNPSNNDKVMVTFANYGIPSVYYTADGGVSWTDISGNLEENADGSGNGPSVRIGRIHGDDSKFYVGTSAGLYSTTSLDGVNTEWIREGASKIGSTVVEHMVTRVDGLVVAATHGNGVYSAIVPFATIDLGVLRTGDLASSLFTDPATVVTVTVENNGGLAASNYNLSLFVDDQLVVTDLVSEEVLNLETYQHTFSEPFDFTEIGTYAIRVEVSISGDEDDSNDVLEFSIQSWAAPSDITLSNSSIPEGSDRGTVIGALAAIDQDGDSHSFQLESDVEADDNLKFRIIDNNLRSDEVFSFDDADMYTVRIKTTDTEGNSFAKLFEVSIEDVLATERWEQSGITVFPNPAKSRVTLEMINDFEGKVNLKLYGSDGKTLVLTSSYSKHTKSTRSLLDVSSLPQGVYFLHIEYGGQKISTKLIRE